MPWCAMKSSNLNRQIFEYIKGGIPLTLKIFYCFTIFLVCYWIYGYYKKISIVAKTKYGIDFSPYREKLAEIYNLLRDSSKYIKNVQKVEVENLNNIIVSLETRKEIFYITDGDKIYTVSDDNKVIREYENIPSSPVFFYPYPITINGSIIEKVDDRLFRQYETIAINIRMFPALKKVKMFYLKTSWDIIHLYFWIDENIKFYGGYFNNITKEHLKVIDKKLGDTLIKIKKLDDISITEVDISYHKPLIKLN